MTLSPRLTQRSSRSLARMSQSVALDRQPVRYATERR
jgi:hypothetical protein